MVLGTGGWRPTRDWGLLLVWAFGHVAADAWFAYAHATGAYAPSWEADRGHQHGGHGPGLVYLLAEAAPAALCIAGALTRRRERMAWVLIGLSCAGRLAGAAGGDGVAYATGRRTSPQTARTAPAARRRRGAHPCGRQRPRDLERGQRTVNARATGVAAAKTSSPGWLAVTVQVPGASRCTSPPTIVHTEDGAAA